MYAEAVFETTIPIATDFKEAIMQRKPVALFKPKGAAAKTMKALADELDRRMTGQDQVRGAA
jgi:chromosome partitioning protein